MAHLKKKDTLATATVALHYRSLMVIYESICRPCLMSSDVSGPTTIRYLKRCLEL